MQDERVLALRLAQAGQVRLLDGRVDVRVPVVLEDPEVPVQAHVDAGWLDKLGREGFDLNAARCDLGPDVPVGEQHAGNLPVPVRYRRGSRPTDAVCVDCAAGRTGRLARVEFNGRTSASQADTAGSIPGT